MGEVAYFRKLFFPLAERKVSWPSKKGDKGKHPLDPSGKTGKTLAATVALRV